MALSRLLPQAEMVVVTTPQKAAQKVAIRVADMARRSHMPLVGVIENMSSFTCDHGIEYALFGEGGGDELAASLSLPLLARVPLDPAVVSGGDEGAPVTRHRPDSPAAMAFREAAAAAGGAAPTGRRRKTAPVGSPSSSSSWPPPARRSGRGGRLDRSSRRD